MKNNTKNRVKKKLKRRMSGSGKSRTVDDLVGELKFILSCIDWKTKTLKKKYLEKVYLIMKDKDSV